MVLSYKIFTLNEANTYVALALGAHTFLVLSQQFWITNYSCWNRWTNMSSKSLEPLLINFIVPV
jgi:hypothetical protein